MKVGIVANEPSGDLLGASLLREIKTRVPGARFVGVAGPHMMAAGCESLVEQERLAVMGLTEVFRHLPELLRIRGEIRRHFLDFRPDVFIGVDAPDFNLGLERHLRLAGIPTVHLVSPTVWAWRPGRVKTLRSAADLVLSIFPFEEPFLREHGVPVRYIGHPLADQIPLEVDRVAARRVLDLPSSGPVLALLPGSRAGEVSLLAKPFVETAEWCLERRPELHFVVPLVSPRLKEIFVEAVGEAASRLPITLVDGQSRQAIAAADCVLTASGTATLETLMSKRPMAVGYRINQLTYRLVTALDLIKVPYVAMANLLAGRELAPEFLQDRCRAELMGPALLQFLDDPQRVARIQREYDRLHRELRRNAGAEAAGAVLELVGET